MCSARKKYQSQQDWWDWLFSKADTCCQFKLTPLLQVEAFKGGFFTGVSMSKAPGPGKMSVFEKWKNGIPIP